MTGSKKQTILAKYWAQTCNFWSLKYIIHKKSNLPNIFIIQKLTKSYFTTVQEINLILYNNSSGISDRNDTSNRNHSSDCSDISNSSDSSENSKSNEKSNKKQMKQLLNFRSSNGLLKIMSCDT